MKTNLSNGFNRLIFRMKWYVMSDRERYAYLWQRTRTSWPARAVS